MPKRTKFESEKPKHPIPGRAQVQRSESALIQNFRHIQKLAKGTDLIPMVKGNAYGHGMVWAVEALKKQKGVYGWGVATFLEAIQLRTAIRSLPATQKIIIFSDSAPWTDLKQRCCERYRLEPVFFEANSLFHFFELQRRSPPSKRIPYHLEFNTGMNRLGLSLDEFAEITVRYSHSPSSVFTHFAESENPDSALTRLQIRGLLEIAKWSHLYFPKVKVHSANSGGIWNRSSFIEIDGRMNQMKLSRPGLSLYGVLPFVGAVDPGLRRVMRVTAPVLKTFGLKAGDRVGYGGTYRATDDEVVATLGGGYADGIFRALGNRGFGVLRGKMLPILGRVSMDLLTIRLTGRANVGDRVEFWGDAVDPYQQAEAAMSNPYELMTRMGSPNEMRIEWKDQV